MDRTACDGAFDFGSKLLFGFLPQIPENTSDEIFQSPTPAKHLGGLQSAAAEKRLHRLDQPAFVIGFEIMLDALRPAPGFHEEFVLLPDLLQVEQGTVRFCKSAGKREGCESDARSRIGASDRAVRCSEVDADRDVRHCINAIAVRAFISWPGELV